MVFIKSNHGFKIKTKDDARKFIEECISGEGCICIKISKTEIYYFHSSKLGLAYITHRLGNLSDIFNPELRLLTEDNVNTVYKIRKYINQRFFNERRYS